MPSLTPSGSNLALFNELVARACNRDSHAAAEIVRHYEPELRRVIRYELRNPQVRRLFDSLDVFQSIMAGFFARLYAGEIHATNPRQLFGLLRVMARHKVADKAKYVKSVKRGGSIRRGSMGSGSKVADTGTGPDEAMAVHDLVSVVRERLSPELRTVLDHRLSGCQWAEIASGAGVSSDAIRKALSRAVDRIAVELDILEDAP